MKMIIKDYKNTEFEEVKDMSVSDIVDIIEASIQSGKWKNSEWLNFNFDRESDIQEECYPFFIEVAKEIATRDFFNTNSVVEFHHPKRQEVDKGTFGNNNTFDVSKVNDGGVVYYKIRDWRYPSRNIRVFEPSTGQEKQVPEKVKIKKPNIGPGL